MLAVVDRSLLDQIHESAPGQFESSKPVLPNDLIAYADYYEWKQRQKPASLKEKPIVAASCAGLFSVCVVILISPWLRYPFGDARHSPKGAGKSSTGEGAATPEIGANISRHKKQTIQYGQNADGFLPQAIIITSWSSRPNHNAASYGKNRATKEAAIFLQGQHYQRSRT